MPCSVSKPSEAQRPAADRPTLKPETSLYLNCIRLLAVAMVFLSHAKRSDFGSTSEAVATIGQYGQQGVTLFFVVSGLVIAHVGATRQTSFADFAAARLGRLWSVVIPAVFLTITLDSLGRAIEPTLYDDPLVPHWSFDAASLWQAVAPILFLNQFAGVEVYVGSNGPFWSLSYECVYYLLFGIVFIARSSPLPRILIACGVAYAAGPQILSLAPLWLVGMVSYRRIGLGAPTRLAWIAWVGSTVLLAICIVGSSRLIGSLVLHGVGREAAFYIVSYALTAVLTAINILSFDRIGGSVSPLAARLRGVVGWIADRSFSIYLYQVPLLFFFATVTSTWTPRPAAWLCTVVATIASALALAEVTECRRAWLTERLGAVAAHSRPRGYAGRP